MPAADGHATYVACGLKFLILVPYSGYNRHATYVACGLKSKHFKEIAYLKRHATYVACGLKYYFVDPNGVVQSGHATYVACGLKFSLYTLLVDGL